MAKIGIDIDDTITDSSSLVKEYVEKYDEYYSDCQILKNRMQDIMRGFFNHEAIVKFYLDHGREISRNVKVRPDAKEMIENSLDAGATSITVEIENGGITLFRITDNGFGMAKDDMVIAFERHATSKIRKSEDLFDLRTLGFGVRHSRPHTLPDHSQLQLTEYTRHL